MLIDVSDFKIFEITAESLAKRVFADLFEVLYHVSGGLFSFNFEFDRDVVVLHCNQDVAAVQELAK